MPIGKKGFPVPWPLDPSSNEQFVLHFVLPPELVELTSGICHA